MQDENFMLLLRLLSTVLWQLMNFNMNFTYSTGFFAKKEFLRAFSHTQKCRPFRQKSVTLLHDKNFAELNFFKKFFPQF
jgi:hypothetical protein